MNRFFGRSNKASQEILDRSEPTIVASYGLIGAIFLFGGLGYLFDRWLNTEPWLLLTGLAAGIVFGFYRLLRVRRS